MLDPRQFLSADDELAHYHTHDNRVDDPGYRTFLARLATPLLELLPYGRHGLDYGSGPGPALAAMMREAGHEMTIYDPFFAPDLRVLGDRYDFITCTEVAEHFYDPAAEFDRLDAMLRPGGWLGIMTTFQTDDARFSNWHYRRDPTHVVFYRRETLQVLASDRGWSVDIPTANVAIFRKPEM